MVLFLQTGAYRVCFLIGGLNAAYYAVIYFTLKLYGLSLYSICVACPIQIVTYLRWRRNAYAQATVLRRLSAKQRIGWAVGFLVAWAALYFVLRSFGSGYLILDNTVAIIGTAANLASFLYLIEFPFIQVVSQALNIALYCQVIRDDPRQWTYLIYSVYALICGILSAVYMQKLYLKQQAESTLKA